MRKKKVKIDETLCNGCGTCVTVCSEGAIKLVNGKATVLSDNHCDGLGYCLPACPMHAISFEEIKKEKKAKPAASKKSAEIIVRPQVYKTLKKLKTEEHAVEESENDSKTQSKLRQWPVQIRLMPVNSPSFENAELLIAADCSAYAYADFHNMFMKDKVTIIGCARLDGTDYAEKLTEIIKHNEIKNLTVIRMEMSCCKGIATSAMKAVRNSGKTISIKEVVIGLDGRII